MADYRCQHGEEHHAAPLEVDGAWARHGPDLPWVLRDLSLHLHGPGAVLVRGCNGAGKTTLLAVLAGSLRPERGSLRIHGLPAGRCHHAVALLAQRPAVDWSFPATVADLVSTGLLPALGWLRRPTTAQRARVEQAIAAVGIAHLTARPLAALSGGERQRALIARALAQRARVLLLDEALNSLDREGRIALASLLSGLIRDEGLCVLVTAHETSDFDLAWDRAFVLNAGVLQEAAPLAASGP